MSVCDPIVIGQHDLEPSQKGQVIKRLGQSKARQMWLDHALPEYLQGVPPVPEEFEFRAFKDPPVNIEVFDSRGPAVKYLGEWKEDGEIVKDARDIPELNPKRFPPRPQ